MKDIAKELLLGIEHRGTDATGMAWFGPKGGVSVDKAAHAASVFTQAIRMGDDTSTAILHTRLATTGSPRDNRNNHPIVAPGVKGSRVVGTHNGWVTNYGSLTRLHDLERHAQVDSEVIFSFLHKYGDNMDKLGNAIDGNYAIAYIREDEPNTIHLARGHSSPLVLMVTVFGVFYASEEYTLRQIQQFVGGPQVGFMEVAEGRALTVHEGEVGNVESFDMMETWGSYYGNQVHGTSGNSGVRQWVRGHGWVQLPDDDDEDFTGWRSSHTAVHVGRRLDGTSRVLDAWTDTKRNVRVYINQTARDRAALVNLGPGKGSVSPSAYGQWVRVSKKGDTVEFQPWKTLPENLSVEEAALEDLLYLTWDTPSEELDNSIGYEIKSLSVQLERRVTVSEWERKSRAGVIFNNNSHVVSEDGYHVVSLGTDDDDPRVVPIENMPNYVKLNDTWYFVQPVGTDDYKLVKSIYQADTDHINPRTLPPPAAATESGGVADYCLIGERIWGMNEDGVWGDLGIEQGELTDEEVQLLGIGLLRMELDEAGDDDETHPLAEVLPLIGRKVS